LSELEQALLNIRKVAGQVKWRDFPPVVRDPMAAIYEAAGQALDLAKKTQGPARRKQLVVIEHSSPVDRKAYEQAIERKCQACGIDAEVLVLFDQATFSMIDGNDAECQSGAAPQAGPDPGPVADPA